MQTTFDQTRSQLPVRVLNDLARSLGKWGVQRSADSAADLIETARRRAGLDDFGPGNFFDGLSRLLEACQREANLNLIGKIALRSDLLRILTTRLLIERDRRADPAIGEEKIVAPLFIVGLPRSGTTLLHTLLAADRENRAPLVWEVMFPSPPSSRNESRRIRQTKQSLFFLQWLAPTFRHVHALGAELPQECVGLMSPSMLSDQFDTMYRIPAYRSWFLNQDLAPAYQYHLRLLQHLQRRKNGRRWVLKAPAHMFALPSLLSIYPDARFVHVHRNPIDAVASVSSLISILRRVFSDQVDPREVGRDAMHYWSKTLITFLEQRDRLPQERICDLDYRDIQANPIAAVRQVYQHFNWPLTGETESRMRHALNNQGDEQNGFHRYEPAQFGLSVEEVKSCFGSYCDRFGAEQASPRASAAQMYLSSVSS